MITIMIITAGSAKIVAVHQTGYLSPSVPTFSELERSSFGLERRLYTGWIERL